ncbi:MAG: hypothetical protein WBE96_09790, partial [Pseudolabrys sp.]
IKSDRVWRLVLRATMSALGHKQTFRSAILISALTPKTDIGLLGADTRRSMSVDHIDLETN